MDYQLAKSLKDAGFPQVGDGEMEHAPIPKDHNPAFLENVLNLPKPCYVPTLSELIEACGEEEDFALFRERGDWIVEYKNPTDVVRLGEVSGEFGGEGKTPEESVARLWLALNKNKDV